MAVSVVPGVLTAHAVERNVNGLRAARHSVAAVLTGDAERTVSSTDGAGDDRARAKARWTGADGTPRTGVTRVGPGSGAGDTTRVLEITVSEGALTPGGRTGRTGCADCP